MVELGWSFTVAEQTGKRVLARNLEDFPATKQLIEEGLSTLGNEHTLCLDKLNVIVRRYRRGRGLPPHVDRQESASHP